MSTNGFNSQPDDNQPQPDAPASAAGAGSADTPFTDWREQLRERVQEIRARKLAGKRGDDGAVDFAEQAAAARAEKLRAAREATGEAPRQSAEPIESSARIERLIEEVSEEVASKAAEASEADRVAPRSLSIEALADVARESEPAAPAAPSAPEPEPVAAAAETEPESVPTLGGADRTARRSEIADVVDAFLDPAPAEPELVVEPEPESIDATLDRVFALQVDEPTTAEQAASAADFEVGIEADSATDLELSASAGASGDEAPALDDEDWEATIANWDEADAAGAEEPSASLPGAPGWAQTDRSSQVSRRESLESVTPEPTGIPPELRDVSIPAWALPRGADRGADREPVSESATDGAADKFAAEAVVTPNPEPAEAVAAETPAEVELSPAGAQRELSELAEESSRAEFEEFEEMMAAAEEIPDPANAPLDADFFEPEPDEANLFTDANPSPVLDLLGNAAAEELTEPEPEESVAAPIAAAELAVIAEPVAPAPFQPKPLAPAPPRPEPAAARHTQPNPPPPAEPAAPATAHAAESSGDDVFLVGEFRSRGEPELEEAPLVTHPPDLDPNLDPDLDPLEALTPEPPRRSLFDEDDVVDAEADPAIDWDLDSPADPDTILDAQRASADPTAPVSDRVFSAMADAMVVLTIALLLAIAGASAAGVPVVPFIQAAPVPFAGACLVFAFAYAVFFNGTCGQTLGKMAMRVRVIGADTFRVGYPKAAWRAFYYTLAALPAGLGLLTALRDPEHRALHDRMSGTRVVKA